MSDNDRGERGLSRRDFLERAVAGAAAVGAGEVLAACSGRSGEAAATATGAPKTGGVLRKASSAPEPRSRSTPRKAASTATSPRLPNLYEPLVGRHPDYTPFMQLAESIGSNATADEWTIRLRDGIEFHNGKTLVAEDVLQSFRRIVDPRSSGSAVSLLALVDFRRSKILDRRTLRVRLVQPLATFVDNLADEIEPVYVVPVGFDVRKPIGTGAFRYASFTPGEQSVFVRNENYWGRKAYAEKLVVISIRDDTSRVNALLSNQVDAISSLPASRISHIENSPGYRTLVSQTQNWIPIVMLTTAPPFDDPRVRQAFRLLVDREQIVAQAFSGHALVERVARMRRALEEVDLAVEDDFLARNPHQLSGGQQQRVCLTAALLRAPGVVVLDEPTTEEADSPKPRLPLFPGTPSLSGRFRATVAPAFPGGQRRYRVSGRRPADHELRLRVREPACRARRRTFVGAAAGSIRHGSLHTTRRARGANHGTHAGWTASRTLA